MNRQLGPCRQFVVTFPAGFERALIRKERPVVLVQVDATDPIAASGAISVLNHLGDEIFSADLPAYRPSTPPLIDLRVHKRS